MASQYGSMGHKEQLNKRTSHDVPDSGDTGGPVVTTALQTSIVIPSYNNVGYLGQCLDSVLDVIESGTEVVVVDDGSEDDIRSLVGRFMPRVRYVRQTNQGPSAARNTGVRETTGEYIRFIDADDYVISAEGLRRQCALLDTYPDLGLVYGQAQKVDSDGRAFAVRKPAFARTGYVHSGEDELGRLLLGNYITTSTVLVRRDVLERAGLFREDIRSGEDWDCWLRMARLSAVGYVAEPIVAYRIHGNSITAGDTLEPWVSTHRDILGCFFAHPQAVERNPGLHRRATAHLYYHAACLAYSRGRVDQVRHYAWGALVTGLRGRQSPRTVECCWIILKSLIPPTLRGVLRRFSRRARVNLMTVRR